MKPVTLTARNRRSFPVADCNYQPMTLEECRSRCAKIEAPSFRNISRQYFEKEARRDFVSEAFFFGAMILIAAAPLLSMASALSQLCRALGQV
jgi:hypothetical protein